MRMLGATVIPVHSGSCTLKDAVNEALRDWVTNLANTHYLIGSAIGPHPFPTIVRDFQRVIGKEIPSSCTRRRPPSRRSRRVRGRRSNAIGTFYDFIPEKTCASSASRLAAKVGGDKHSATLSKGHMGVFHGRGLDYPGVGPEHAWLKDSGRAEYTVATDEQALRGFRMLTQLEGIIPALESSHAIWGGVELAKTLPKDAHIVICLSGRGDKDVEQISQLLPGKWEDILDWHISNTL
ncbi:Tryptophan synthase [Grifola frondosa]|uniref:Tryptophan synthase n=1 Tax=Grifola frondosa TaxID=5627 RepID=A0A1C7MES9_GRIFR|nr:Tryptophan synthase [Grifola frondosa]